MSTKDLIDEVKNNIKTDRARLTDLYDSIKEKAKEVDDSFGLAAVSENLVKITDSLTKQNGQLVDLAKLKQKIESEKAPETSPTGGFGEADAEEVFDEIEKPAN